ncbi:MAG TPA: hypothetical protein VGQ87_03855 [Patescibacteria group bacterium]|nr:hypothetical protein [Patescibacteria group bacterium]
MQSQLKTAFIETIGDGPWFSDLAIIYDGVNDFYQTAATSAIVLFSPSKNDEDLMQLAVEVKSKLYESLVRLPEVWFAHRESIAANFMTEEPLYNIVPNYEQKSETIATVSDQELSMMLFGLLEKEVNSSLSSQPIAQSGDVNVGLVAGTWLFEKEQPVNSQAQPWVTVQDNMTGQLFCLAIYDGEVNKYSGPCRYDYQ